MDSRYKISKAVHQRRTRRDLNGQRAGVLPGLEQSDRGDCVGIALHSRRFRPGHRPRGGELDAGFCLGHSSVDSERWRPITLTPSSGDSDRKCIELFQAATVATPATMPRMQCSGLMVTWFMTCT